MELADVAGSLREVLDQKTSARERGLSSSRSAIRSCGNAIRAMHRYEMDRASELLGEAQGHLDDARGDGELMLHVPCATRSDGPHAPVVAKKCGA